MVTVFNYDLGLCINMARKQKHDFFNHFLFPYNIVKVLDTIHFGHHKRKCCYLNKWNRCTVTLNSFVYFNPD